MITQENHRAARVEARIDQCALLRRAAKLQRRSVSDFMVTAAQQAVNRTIEETTTKLSPTSLFYRVSVAELLTAC